MAIKAGIKKEYLSFSRTFKMWGVLIAVVALSLIDPALIKVMSSVMNNATQIISEDQSADTNVQPTSLEAEAEQGGDSSLAGATGLLGNLSSPETAIYMATNDIASTCMLILMLVMMAAAGGELKKRATIIPNCSGLTPGRYLIPKFIFYPAYIFILSILGITCSNLICIPLYGKAIDYPLVLLAGVMLGTYMIFMLSVYMCIGLCTARAGIAVAVVYGGMTIISAIFMGFGAEKFTPFALTSNIPSVLGGSIDTVDVLGSIGVSLVLSTICFFITMMVMTARQIDNMGEERGVL